ncbi:MAG: hypothetical protein HC892_12300 [Saprospiraceae bacterium]|nr:hypothetical protein [Saprospiraceae bacterium]
MKSKANNTNYDLIQRFKEIEMSKEELLAFDRRMAEDAVLREQMERYTVMEDFIDGQFNTLERQNTMRTHFQTLVKERKLQLTSWRILAMAASLAGLSIGIYFIAMSLSKTTVQLADNYLKDSKSVLFSNTKTLEVELLASERTLIAASTLVEQDSFGAALKLLQTIPNDDSLSLSATLLKGQIAIEQKIGTSLLPPSKLYWKHQKILTTM